MLTTKSNTEVVVSSYSRSDVVNDVLPRKILGNDLHIKVSMERVPSIKSHHYPTQRRHLSSTQQDCICCSTLPVTLVTHAIRFVTVKAIETIYNSVGRLAKDLGICEPHLG